MSPTARWPAPTSPYKVIEQMTKHPLTDAGIEKFRADYVKVFGA